MPKTTPEVNYPGKGNPWMDCLHHRARALRWLRDEMHETPAQIARTMSMDEIQVAGILYHVDRHPEEYEPAK